MSHCLNPTCTHPHHPDSHADTCQTCGAILRLQGRYLPLFSIGQGGFGRTFVAVDEADPGKPRCVIKQFFPQASAHREHAAALFRQEAARLQRLSDHPQIPSLIAYLEQDGQQYLIQEYIDGPNLALELAQNGPFTEFQVRQLLADLLPVVQFIHDRQIIHRDIKPANIIRRTAVYSADSTGEWVLVDLGAAQAVTGTSLAKTGTVIGSAEFTAPEQARGKAAFASDLYSLGATCVHLLTEMSPFDLFDSHEAQWIWRDYLPQAVSPDLGRVLDRLLAPGTNHRYASAAAVLADLPAIARPTPRTNMQALANLPTQRDRPLSPRHHHRPPHRPKDYPSRRPGSFLSHRRASPLSRRQRQSTLELARGSQALILLVPLIFGVVLGVSWLDQPTRSPRSTPPSLPNQPRLPAILRHP
jgi:serine/threonine protein kinase